MKRIKSLLKQMTEETDLCINEHSFCMAVVALDQTVKTYPTTKCKVLRILGVVAGAMVLGKLPVPGRPTNLDNSRARAYCACSGCGWGLFGHFFSHLSFLFSFSLSLGDGPI